MGAKKEHKILRIGVVHEGRIIEERLLRKPSDVTVGASPKCTFILPIPNLPESYRLFLYRNKKYILRFTAGMVGVVSVQDKLTDLKELRNSPYVQKQGDYYLFPLDENTRGKLVFGEVSLLFQFVLPPPPIPKLELPAAAKGGILTRLDAPLFVSMLVSLVLQVGAIGGVQVWWNTSGKFKPTTTKRYAQVFELLKAEVQKTRLSKPPEQQKKAEKEGPGEKDEGKKVELPKPAATKSTKSPVTQVPRRPVGEKPIDPEELYRRRLAKVTDKTFIKFLGGAGPGGIVRGAAVSQAGRERLDSASLQGRQVETASADTGPSGFRAGAPASGAGGTTYQKLMAQQIGGSMQAGPVAGGTMRTVGEVKVRLTSFEGGSGSQPDDKAVFDFLSSRATAYRGCYEKRLREKPDLQGGKVVFQVTITPAGTASKVSVLVNGTGDEEVAKCIIDRVKTWRFPAPKNAMENTYAFTMILMPPQR